MASSLSPATAGDPKDLERLRNATLKSIKKAFQESIHAVLKESPKGNVVYNEEQRKQFWAVFEANAKSLTHNANVLVISFREAPLPKPQEVITMLEKIGQCVPKLTEGYFVLSPKSGKSFLIVVSQFVERLLNLTLELLQEFSDFQKLSVVALSILGRLWEASESINCMPKSQSEACARSIYQEQQLVNDAMQELTNDFNMAKSGEERADEEPSYVSRDFKILPPAIGLIKTTSLLMKKIITALKTSGNNDEEGPIEEMQEVKEKCLQLSSVVDDFVISLEPPLSDLDHVWEKSQKLTTVVDELRKQIEKMHYLTQSDKDGWLQTLIGALKHNSTNLGLMLMERGISGLEL